MSITADVPKVPVVPVKKSKSIDNYRPGKDDFDEAEEAEVEAEVEAKSQSQTAESTAEHSHSPVASDTPQQEGQHRPKPQPSKPPAAGPPRPPAGGAPSLNQTATKPAPMSGTGTVEVEAEPPKISEHDKSMWESLVKAHKKFDRNSAELYDYIKKADREDYVRRAARFARDAGVSQSEAEEVIAMPLSKGMYGRSDKSFNRKKITRYVAEVYGMLENGQTNAAPKSPQPESSAAVLEPLPLPTPEESLKQWHEVESIMRKNFLNPDVEAAKIVYASVASHKISAQPPSWNMVIAPAGSMKTVILESLDGLPGVYSIDEVTAQTFISGKLDDNGDDQKRTTPASLLHRIGEQGIIVIPDFSTVLEIDPKQRGKILSQFRRIYDGHLHREFGSDENLEERDWRGRITVLAGATPAVDSFHKIFAALGDRFVRTRWPRVGGAEAAMMAMDQDKQVFEDFRKAVYKFLLPIISQPEITSPALPMALKLQLAHLSEFVALARTYVPRNSQDKEIDGAAQAESNTRLPQELAQIGRGWAALMGRSEVNEEDFQLMRRAAWDCIPPVRATLLKAIMNGQKPHTAGLPKATANRGLEDLQAVGLVVKTERAPGVEELVQYELSDPAIDLLAKSEPAAPEGKD